jgi:hypothetical protein
MAWFALETVVFSRHGQDVTFPAIETTGPAVAASSTVEVGALAPMRHDLTPTGRDCSYEE